MLRFSANISLLFAEYPLAERFAQARLQGFQAVEIQFPYELPAEQIRVLLQENQLELILFNVPAADILQGGEGLAAVPEKQAEFKLAVQQALAYAKVLQPRFINVLPGCCHKPERFTEYLDCFKENLAYTCEVFAKIRVKTLFEAINTHDMPGFIVNSSQQMLAILTELKLDQLGMQYDIYHLTRMGEDCGQFILQHAENISHIQFADVPGRGQPGTGTIDFAYLFDLINRSAYAGWLGAEYRPTLDTSASLAWLKASQSV